MISDLFSLRETEIFRTLVSLQSRHFVVIGGYAVNAYTLPRFSVDCDIVIRRPEAEPIEKNSSDAAINEKLFPKILLIRAASLDMRRNSPTILW